MHVTDDADDLATLLALERMRRRVGRLDPGEYIDELHTPLAKRTLRELLEAKKPYGPLARAVRFLA